MKVICIPKRVDGQKRDETTPTDDVIGDPVIITVASHTP